VRRLFRKYPVGFVRNTKSKRLRLPALMMFALGDQFIYMWLVRRACPEIAMVYFALFSEMGGGDPLPAGAPAGRLVISRVSVRSSPFASPVHLIVMSYP
jgi:hypothetical protein